MLTSLSDLDLRLVRVFLAVVDARGVTAAEATVGARQSTISSQLSVLETRIGFALCERGRGGFRLTPKGERFVVLARALMAQTAQFVAQVQHIDRKLVGTLSIGLIGHASLDENARLAKALATFRQRDEAVRIHMRVATSTELETQILNQQLDLAIGYFCHRADGIAYSKLFDERQVICCGRGHPLFHHRGQVQIEHLRAHQWVWRTYPVPEEIASISERQVTATADNVDAATVLILSGRHIGYLPKHHAHAFEQRGLIRVLNETAFGFDVPHQLASRPSQRDNPIVRAFCEDLLDAYGKQRGCAASSSRDTSTDGNVNI
ncbi:LysR family transcriptional regulator [Bordetella sp. 15P40C-2]|uniref:LysR family transcriptional regulator n=1 Tax=Bordetella sp. 15P40C-2 TaxID=2572246 RepID=UPI001320D016|nr:LysR family transcriptional regulator [Bordetella sp. 15P40C-2]MVW72517.1 LysR family transcriptional regulator [Bordetella sp. 15P40C-2]